MVPTLSSRGSGHNISKQNVQKTNAKWWEGRYAGGQGQDEHPVSAELTGPAWGAHRRSRAAGRRLPGGKCAGGVRHTGDFWCARPGTGEMPMSHVFVNG